MRVHTIRHANYACMRIILQQRWRRRLFENAMSPRGNIHFYSTCGKRGTGKSWK